MPHKNVYITNGNLWEEVKKEAFKQNKTLNGLIEEILTLYLSREKEKALTPEKVGFYIKNNFAKGRIINDITIAESACGDVWISKRKFKTIIDDLILNGVISEKKNPHSKSVRIFEVM